MEKVTIGKKTHIAFSYIEIFIFNIIIYTVAFAFGYYSFDCFS